MSEPLTKFRVNGIETRQCACGATVFEVREFGGPEKQPIMLQLYAPSAQRPRPGIFTLSQGLTDGPPRAMQVDTPCYIEHVCRG